MKEIIEIIIEILGLVFILCVPVTIIYLLLIKYLKKYKK